MSTNLAQRLAQGRQLARKAHRDLDHTKLGTLRAGNSGVMSEDGDFAGSCPRRAHLRSLGIEVEEPDDSKLIMFQMGTANETVVYNDLVHTSNEDEVILQEEQIPISWTTTNGTKVTGRPDMVVCSEVEDKSIGSVLDPEGSPVWPKWGVEIKSIASVWTSREVLGNQQPKLEHMIQAGHYAWKLGVPFKLLYKQYSIQEIPFWKGSGKGADAKPGWGQSLFPKQGEPGSECIDYEKGRIQPFEISYELSWTKGVLHYRREGSIGTWQRTLIQQVDIERYYEFVSRMAETKQLGDRPMTVDAAGKEKSFSLCNYCPLKETCTKYEKKGYTEWLERVRQVMSNGSVVSPPDELDQKAIRAAKQPSK